jgi:enamine deaminase RidA (YjgF/YER057c/UK114 family)
MSVEHLNPKGMYQSPVFSQGIILPANARILLIGGQNGVDEKGEIVHKTDVARQTEQALANMQKVLAAAGASVKDLVKVTIILHQDADLQAGFSAWMKVWGKNTNPPTVTSLRVAGFANPDFLIEIEAQAVLP